MKGKVFAEIGFGNESFLSTEIEKGKEEYRIKGFVKPKKVDDVYFRLWILKRVLIISTKDKIKFKKKPKNRFKVIFGIGGSN